MPNEPIANTENETEIIEELSPELKAKDEKETAELKSIVSQVTDTNKVLDDVYDEKMRKLDTLKKLTPTNEQEEELHKNKIQTLIENYQELMSKISACRKSGKDPFIAYIISKSIQAKIKIAQVTREQRDFDQVKELIARAHSELQLAESEEMLNIKKEIEQRLIIEKEKMQSEISPKAPSN